MERPVFFLCLLSCLLFAEASSWLTAGGLGPCLIKAEHSEQAANHNEHEDCPTFFAGSLLSFERGFEWIKRDDNDKAVVAGFTIVLAISTIGLWIATNKLWRAGETQRNLADDTARRQLRAYVFVKNGRMDRLQGSILRADISLENGGQTPAYDLIYKGRVFIVPPENTDEIGPFSEEMVVIGPRSPSPIRISGRLPLSIEHQNAYETGALKIIVLGVIQYRDAFDEIQITEFGFEVFGDVWSSKGHLRQIKGQYKQT